MNGARLRTIVDGWTPEDLESFYAFRLHHMLHGNGNLLHPALKRIEPYMPFEDAHYVWSKELGPLSTPIWTKLMRMRPEELLCGDPFAPSLARPGKYRVWDAAVAVPACHLRVEQIRSFDDIAAMRRCNLQWLNEILPALKHVGPIGFNREVLRPAGPYIFDLTTMKDGWLILEAAHALTHLRGDMKPIRQNNDNLPGMTQLNGRFMSTVAELLIARHFDLPIDVTAKEDGDPAAPDFQYGLELKVSSNFLDPVLKMPVVIKEAAKPDRTIGVLVASAHIEPHPHGFATKTDIVGPNDHWCCMPTIVTVVGWECMDVISHQPLAVQHYKGEPSKKAPLCYAMRPADLMPPYLLWGYLASAYKKLGPPVTNERWRYFDEWIASQDHKDLMAKTPPLVCKECLTFVKHSDTAPKHPVWLASDADKDEIEENKMRADGVARVHKIITTAIEKHERRYVYQDARVANDARKSRRSAHVEKMLKLDDTRRFIKVLRKLRNCGTVPPGKDTPVPALTQKQWDTYYGFIREKGVDTANEIEARAAALGWLDL